MSLYNLDDFVICKRGKSQHHLRSIPSVYTMMKFLTQHTDRYHNYILCTRAQHKFLCSQISTESIVHRRKRLQAAHVIFTTHFCAVIKPENKMEQFYAARACVRAAFAHAGAYRGPQDTPWQHALRVATGLLPRMLFRRGAGRRRPIGPTQ